MITMVRRQKQARRAVMGSIVGAALAVLLMGCCWLMPDSRADASSHYRSRRGMPSRSQSRSHAHSHSNLHSRRGAGSSMVPDREYGYDDDNDNDNDNDNEEELELQQELELELGDTLWTPTTDWQASSSYSSSEEDAFVDVDDLTEHRRRRTRTRSGPGRKRSKPSKTKRGRSRETMERAERLLRALEEDDEVPRVAATAASQSTRRRSKAKSKLKSKSKSKSKRRRKTKKAPSVVATADLSGSSNSSNNNSSNNSRIRGVGPSPSRRSPAASATPATASASAAASRSAVASTVAPSKLSSPQEHPDRTTWEVPSYSHKISTMMKKTQSNQPANNINNNNNLVHAPNAKKASAPATTATATATARTTTSVPTASRVPPRSAPATKPSASRAAAPQASTGTGTTPWVRKFLAGRPRDRLLPLPRDYISDNFNLAQLPPIVERIGYEAMGDNAIPVAKALQQHRIAAAAAVAAESSNGSNTKPVSPTTKSTTSTSYPIYRRALRLILAEEGAASDADTDTDTEEDRIIPQHAIQTAAEALYLLLHARFVVSPRGLEAIRHVMALDNTVFGRCPRSTCHGTGLLPYGHSNDYTSDASGRSNAVGTTTTQQQQQQQQRDARCHRYCPCCGEVWVSWDSKTDGCAWGPSWCHLFLLAFGTQVYATELAEAAARRANANANGVPAAATPSSYGVAPLVPPPSPLLSRAFLPRTQPRAGVVHAATTAPAAPAAPAPRGHGDESEATSSRPTPSVFGFRVHPATAFGRPWNEPLVPSSLRGGGVGGGGGGAFYTNTNTGYYSSPSPYDYHHT